MVPQQYRVGHIHYTNAAPITDPLALPPGISAVHGVPTEMNQALLAGEVDLANISAVEFIRNADKLAALPDFSVSVLGPVYSVSLFHARPWHELGGARIALTKQSASSAGLLQVLLRESGVEASFERAEGAALDLLRGGFDGVLRIGDTALQEWYEAFGEGEDISAHRFPAQRGGVIVTDLAQQWHELTGQPFVFAVWAYRKDNPPPAALIQALRQARRRGLGSLGDIAERYAGKLSLPAHVVQHYLWNFRYHLEAADRLGLERFAGLTLPSHAPLCFA